MNTITIKTTATEVTVSFTAEAIAASKEATLKSLTEKMSALKDEFNAIAEKIDTAWAQEQLETVLAAKSKKGEELLPEYEWQQLFAAKTNTKSLSGFLTSKGIDKSLHGSCNRAHNVGKAVVTALLPNALPYSVIRNAVINAIGGKDAAWHNALLEFMGYLNEAEEATAE